MAKKEEKKNSVPEKKDEEKQQAPLTSQPAEVKVEIPKPGEAASNSGTAATQAAASAPADTNTETASAATPAQTKAKSIDEQMAELKAQNALSTWANADRVRTAGEKAYLDYTDNTIKIKRDLEATDKAAEEAGKSYTEMVQGWIDARNAEIEKQRKFNEEQDKRADRTRTWGGITEAAAAIANLIGTAHGATNQTWTSPQNKWAERADALRRERDKKLEDLRSQMKTLEAQKAQLEYNIGIDKANRDTKRETMLAGRADNAAKFQNDTAAAVVKLQAQGAAKDADLDLKRIQLEQDERQHAENTRLSLARIAATKSQNGTGSGIPKDAFSFTSGSTTYVVDKDSLIATMNANVDLLSEEDAATLRDINGDDKLSPEQRANKVLPFLKKYPGLAEALEQSAYYVYKGKKEDEKEEANGGSRRQSKIPGSKYEVSTELDNYFGKYN